MAELQWKIADCELQSEQVIYGLCRDGDSCSVEGSGLSSVLHLCRLGVTLENVAQVDTSSLRLVCRDSNLGPFFCYA